MHGRSSIDTPLPGKLDSLEALNRRLWAYIEGEYHQAPHRGLGGAM